MTALAVHTSGTGPDLVLLHGWGMHSGVFDEIAPLLNSHFTLHRVDLPGHGASTGFAHMPNLAAIADLLASQLPRAIWLGWSLGGMALMALALAHPRRITRLILTATTPRWQTAADWPHGMPAEIFHAFHAQLVRDHVATWQRFLSLEVHGSDTASRDLRQLRSVAQQHAPPDHQILDEGLALLGTVDLRQQVATIDHPALLIGGPRDRLVNPAAMHWLAGQMPNARLEMIAGTGHAPFLGRPQQFCEAVVDHAAAPMESAHV